MVVRGLNGGQGKLDRVAPPAYHLPRDRQNAVRSFGVFFTHLSVRAPMRGLPLEPAERVRRALFPVQGNQIGWRVASVTVSSLSVVLIALTLGYRFRGAELPPTLLLALLLTFATVVVLLSKFLFWAQKEEGQFEGAWWACTGAENLSFRHRLRRHG
jgi:hypothetical protein